MSNMFWKSIPALVFALGVGGYAQGSDLALTEVAGKDKPVTRSRNGAVPCGIVEGNQCYARACSMAGGGALEFDVLYWRAENQGFQLANLSRTTGISIAKKPIFVAQEWSPGFRLGMGWNTTYDRWDLFVNWTLYKNHANGDVTVQTPGWEIIAQQDNFLAMKGSWKLWNNCLDMELGRAYYLTERLSLRSHYGVRGAVLKQKSSATFSIPTGTVLGETDRSLNKFWGVGPRAGVQTKYHVGKGFCVVGKGAFAVLFGQEKWKAKSIGYTANLPAVDFNKNGDMFQTLVPNLNLFLGIEWDTCVSCDEVFFGMQAGWEVNYWMNQYAIQLPTNVSPANNPVTMEGLTVNFHVDF